MKPDPSSGNSSEDGYIVLPTDVASLLSTAFPDATRRHAFLSGLIRSCLKDAVRIAGVKIELESSGAFPEEARAMYILNPDRNIHIL